MSVNQQIDEFGRDMTLRLDSWDRYMNEITRKLKTMSWAEFSYEAEEEEERELEAKQKIKMQELEAKQKIKMQELEEIKRVQRAKDLLVDQQRKALLAKGDYELEEGEILE
jgi:hypothetical protein